MFQKKKYDYLIVGSGLSGSYWADAVKKYNKTALVIERRNHVGGNLYCENIEGINVHKYGAHIFHTDDRFLWNELSYITPFNNYVNRPVALYQTNTPPYNEVYNLPFNMNTFNRLWDVVTPKEADSVINRQRQEILDVIGNREPSNLEEAALLMVGRDIYEKLIKEYTEKQWGRKCTELPPFIIKRLPVRLTYDNNYFNDACQGIPVGGYNKWFDYWLKDVEVLTGVDYFENRDMFDSLADNIIFTGKIDEFFGYGHGNLEYRSLSFYTSVFEESNFQGNAVFNYTSNQVPYTRTIEHKHFEMFGDDIYKNGKTVVSFEYPEEWNPSKEPYYPINNKRNNEIYDMYAHMEYKGKNVVFSGRLAEYKYYDMDDLLLSCQSKIKKELFNR